MEIPRIPSIFRNIRREPRRFKYRSMFYNAQEEELEERKRRIEEELRGGSSGTRDSLLSGRLSGTWRKHRSHRIKAANLRLMVVLGILIFLTYMIIRWLESH